MDRIDAQVAKSLPVIRDAESKLRLTVEGNMPDSVDLENLVHEDPTVKMDMDDLVARIAGEIKTVLGTALMEAVAEAVSRLEATGFALDLGGDWEAHIIAEMKKDERLFGFELDNAVESLLQAIR